MKHVIALLAVIGIASTSYSATLTKTSKVGQTSVQWTRADAGATTVTLTKEFAMLGGRNRSVTSQTINIGAGLQSGNVPGGPFTIGQHRITVLFDDNDWSTYTATTTESATIAFRTYGWTSVPMGQVPETSPLPVFMTAMADPDYRNETFPRSQDDLTTPIVPAGDAARIRAVQILLLRIGHSVSARNQNASPDYLARLICQEIALTDFSVTYGLDADLTAADRGLLLSYCGWTAKMFLLAKNAAEIAALQDVKVRLLGVKPSEMEDLK